jgi:hypothetical protein
MKINQKEMKNTEGFSDPSSRSSFLRGGFFTGDNDADQKA